jgi:hypothetical protein
MNRVERTGNRAVPADAVHDSTLEEQTVDRHPRPPPDDDSDTPTQSTH